ncbi:hypothetical protein Dimus_008859 [Dionaea muscipula]
MATHSVSRVPSTILSSRSNLRRPSSSSSSPLYPFPSSLHSLENPWLGALNLSLHFSKAMPISRKYHRFTSNASLIPTTANKPRVFNAPGPKWSCRAIKAFTMAELEARKLRYPNTGTEALILGIIIEGTSLASRFLRGHGISLTKAREESEKLLGKGPLTFCSPQNPPLTEEAQNALDWAIDEKLKAGGNVEITTSDLLLGIWSNKESSGHKILVSLGFDDEKAAKLESMSSEPGFDEG